MVAAGRGGAWRRGRDMATEGDVELELETEPSGPERPPEKPRKHDSGAADLERVTDYAEEKEIQSSNLETVRAAAVACGGPRQAERALGGTETGGTEARAGRRGGVRGRGCCESRVRRVACSLGFETSLIHGE